MARAYTNRLQWPARVLALLALALLAACADSTGARLLDPSAAEPLISEADEVRLGAAEHPKIVAAFGGAYTNARVQAGLERVVTKLVRVSPRPDIKYRTTILNSPTINAFALPGGYLYVTRGLITLANDGDELAAVLAHEMAHVSARHAAKRQSQAIRAVFLGRVAGVLRDPTSIGQAMRESENLLARFSRQQEFEADEIGVETAVKAGYDPYGAASFLRAMGHESALRERMLYRGAKTGQEFLATHPTTPERISRVSELAGRFGFKRGNRARERKPYLDLIDGMLFGDDPREGFVRGHRFIHPVLRFTFEAPDGYTLQNARTAVFAVGGDDSALRFDGVTVAEDEKLTDYVRARWSQGTPVKEVQALPGPDGIERVIARTVHDGWHYRMAAVRLEPERVYRFLFAARQVSDSMEQTFLDVVSSLRPLNDREAATATPLRIEVVRVAPGDTPAALAARMAGSEKFRLERFQVLNGLGDGDRLKAGQEVKLVSE